MNIIKNSSVALTIGLLELTGRARAMQEFSFRVFEAFTAATVIYLLTNLVVVLGMRMLEKKVRVPGLIAAGNAPQAGHQRHASGSLMDSGFDFAVIQKTLPYMFRERMPVT